MTPLMQWILGTAIMLTLAIITHAFYFGRLLGRMTSSLEHIEGLLVRNDLEHKEMWTRINRNSDRIYGVKIEPA